MPRKSVKNIVKPVVLEEPEVKPSILKSEEVVEKPVGAPITQVSQLASVVEPEKVAELPVQPIAPVVPEVTMSQEIPEVKKKTMFLWPIWIAVAFILGAGAGFGFSKFNFEKKPVVKPVQINKPVVSPTAQPTKIPVNVFDRAKIKVKVLNGSGEKGKAAAAKEYLEGLGYKEVATGNADADNYANTELSIKDSLKENLEKIKADLTNKYVLGSKVSTLASDDAFDVLVIIGQK